MIYVFAAWTVFVWGTRIDNVVSDGGAAGALVIAAGMALMGAAVGIAAFLRRPAAVATVVLALGGATVVVWAVRTPMILLDGDRGAAFKLVHAALAVISVGLALAALRRVRGERPAVTGSRPASG
jgi:hypothetical protein